ncbi:hypothetical protein [Hyphococcus sp.]|uniref:hypothetical protein n=1 Tax=Hyphococcus sp. TaxID=2038636 RepID=UPI003CCBE632
MRIFIPVFFLPLIPFCANAQDVVNSIAFEDKEWRIAAREAEIGEHLGRAALILRGGRLWLDDLEFSDGVIEFDVAFDEGQGFMGPMWRAEDDDRFEEIYFRTHLSGKPDAVQYTPVENSLSAWQIFSDGNAQAAIDLNYDGWNHVKVIVKGDAAEFYFNSDAPQLHIPDLKTDIASGKAGLRVSGQQGVGRFSNITFRPLRPGEKLIGEPKEAPAPPEGLISEWRISSPVAEAAVENALTLDDDDLNGLAWRTLSVETNGIANLAKLADAVDGADTVFVRLTINAEEAVMKELRFGYSDRVRLYLNGKRVYHGDAGWRVRDYRFLGTVGFFDSVGLDLKPGDNEILVAISETFGGWAFAGAMEDQSGVTLSSQ